MVDWNPGSIIGAILNPAGALGVDPLDGVKKQIPGTPQNLINTVQSHGGGAAGPTGQGPVTEYGKPSAQGGSGFATGGGLFGGGGLNPIGHSLSHNLMEQTGLGMLSPSHQLLKTLTGGQNQQPAAPPPGVPSQQAPALTAEPPPTHIGRPQTSHQDESMFNIPPEIFTKHRHSPFQVDVRGGGNLDPNICAYQDSLRTLQANFSTFDTASGVRDGRVGRDDLRAILDNPNASERLKTAARFLMDHDEYWNRLDASAAGGAKNGVVTRSDLGSELNKVGAEIRQDGGAVGFRTSCEDIHRRRTRMMDLVQLTQNTDTDALIVCGRNRR
jgi:hypothetical protein